MDRRGDSFSEEIAPFGGLYFLREVLDLNLGYGQVPMWPKKGTRMKFKKALQEGIFLKRYKRFFTDIEFQGQTLVAHTANTGSLKGVAIGGQPCLFSESDNPERKLKHTLEMIQAPTGAWVGVNTSVPNALTKEALEKAKAGEGYAFWSGFDQIKPEFKLNAETRIDFVLFAKDKTKLIEVKNVTLAENSVAMFPDSVTERGQKHLRELIEAREKNQEAEILFVVQRNDCESFRAAAEIDPEYARLLKLAFDHGVTVRALVAKLSPTEIELTEKELPILWS